ncbi:asparaginase [Halalkalibacter kiskunsagensis]|uniref:Asparaginase n=1 Tax=Halalkalibacter kiskunsagensis TaxID=1548599 RepID=A0ABV6KF36_9BACI
MISRLVVEERRSSIVENYHPINYVILNKQKEIKYSSGDIESPVYFRSAAKPLQAIPAFLAGAPKAYHLTENEAALFCASHRGENIHQKQLRRLIGKLKISEERLVCNHSYPLNTKPKEELIWRREKKRRLLHNCSGKHAGMIAASRLNGWDENGYEKENHPLQKQIHHIIKELSECRDGDMIVGLDGCGVPTLAIPLYNLALTYLKFVCLEYVSDPLLKGGIEEVGRVMNQAPEMIASNKFICTELLRDSNIIAKGGAEGVYTFALRKEKVSIALKVTSGSEVVWPIVITHILEKLSYSNVDTITRLKETFPAIRFNDAGAKTGYLTVREEVY